MHFSPPDIIARWPSVVLVCIVFVFLRSLYRLYLHPLAHIPGPKLAAISRAYEFYYDVVRNGKYIWEIEKMHELYGE